MVVSFSPRNLTLQFWGESLQTACYLINCLPTPLLSHRTPFELLHGHPPILSHLRVFGCLCYTTNLTPTHKFDTRARRCLFIGYPPGQKGYRVYDLDMKKFFVSPDVVFHEHTFPFAVLPLENQSDLPNLPFSHVESDSPLNPAQHLDNHHASPPTLPNLGPPAPYLTAPPLPLSPSTHIPLSPSMESSLPTLAAPSSHPHLNSSTSPATLPPITPPAPSPPASDSSPAPIIPLPRRSELISRPPGHFRDYQAHHVALLLPSAVASSTSGTRHPLHWYISCSTLSPTYRQFVYNICRLVEPSSYEQACHNP